MILAAAGDLGIYVAAGVSVAGAITAVIKGRSDKDSADKDDWRQGTDNLIKSLQSEVGSAHDEAREARREAAECHGECGKLRDENAQLKAQVSQLTTENAGLRARVVRLEEKNP